MEKEIDYQNLYRLQDEVMHVVFDLENDFYLTGGTALHRFYYHLRYSDDLDFFAYDDLLFGENFKEIVDVLEKNFLVDIEVLSKDFKRIKINKILQVDFVNDRVFRYGKSNLFGKNKIDNKINILTNKICAITERDEEKDVFDLICFSWFENINWAEVLDIAKKKSFIQKEALIYRLKTFPLELLNNIKTTKKVDFNANLIEKIILNIQENYGKN